MDIRSENRVSYVLNAFFVVASSYHDQWLAIHFFFYFSFFLSSTSNQVSKISDIDTNNIIVCQPIITGGHI